MLAGGEPWWAEVGEGAQVGEGSEAGRGELWCGPHRFSSQGVAKLRPQDEHQEHNLRVPLDKSMVTFWGE